MQQIASQVAKQLKTWDFKKLGNIGKFSNLVGDIAQCPVYLP